MMKRILNIILILILAIIVSGSLWIFMEIKNRDSESVSPLPEFLTLSKNNQVKLLDIWFPRAEKTESLVLGAKDITAKSALIYDISKDNVIFEKEPDKKLPMASLTKIMTAIIALENKLHNNSYLVTEESLVGENSMGLTAGEVMKMEDLLYGLLLPSGNDAAEVLASNYPTGREGFITAMNQKAESLGLKNTNFTNPSGLQGDGNQYSTAYDLLVITRYALENFSLFAKVVSTAEHTIPQTRYHKAYKLYNETNLLTTYEGVKGVKTGFTDEAGLCLVTYLDYKGHKIVAIILNSADRRAEMRNLLDYALSAYGITPPKYKG
jgi:serine-type D-Ala-D-Ala carboxypeptidase (penicillin-binding protein 5/6)